MHKSKHGNIKLVRRPDEWARYKLKKSTFFIFRMHCILFLMNIVSFQKRLATSSARLFTEARKFCTQSEKKKIGPQSLGSDVTGFACLQQACQSASIDATENRRNNEAI